MVREVGVHDNDEGARSIFQAVDVGGAETHLARAGLQDDVRRAVDGLQLFGDGESAVRGAVVDDYNFPIKIAGGTARISI